MKIRRAHPDDAPHFTRLAHAAKGNWGYPAEWMAKWKDALTVTPEYLEEHRGFVAESEGNIVGVCVLEVQAGHASLEHVWIDPARQRQGIGRSLLDEALKEAKAAGFHTIELLADPYAQDFYTRMGAERTGEVPAPMPGAADRTLPRFEFRI